MHYLISPTLPLLSPFVSGVHYLLEQWASTNLESGARRITGKRSEAQLMWGVERGRETYNNTSSALTHRPNPVEKTIQILVQWLYLQKTAMVFLKLFLQNSEETVLEGCKYYSLNLFYWKRFRGVCVFVRVYMCALIHSSLHWHRNMEEVSLGQGHRVLQDEAISLLFSITHRI